jgi:hypothetical protein
VVFAIVDPTLAVEVAGIVQVLFRSVPEPDEAVATERARIQARVAQSEVGDGTVILREVRD